MTEKCIYNFWFVIHALSRLKMREADFRKIMIKVEKILKGSLDSIPSPSHSIKIQIMGGKVCLRQNIAGHCQQTFCFQKFAVSTSSKLFHP